MQYAHSANRLVRYSLLLALGTLAARLLLGSDFESWAQATTLFVMAAFNGHMVVAAHLNLLGAKSLTFPDVALAASVICMLIGVAILAVETLIRTGAL